MSNKLRSSIIRLAHSNPELRPHLLPLLSKEAGNLEEALNPYALDPEAKGWEKVNKDLHKKVTELKAILVSGKGTVTKDTLKAISSTLKE